MEEEEEEEEEPWYWNLLYRIMYNELGLKVKTKMLKKLKVEHIPWNGILFREID